MDLWLNNLLLVSDDSVQNSSDLIHYDPTAGAALTINYAKDHIRSQMDLILRERQCLEKEKENFYKERDDFIRNSPALQWQLAAPLDKNQIAEFLLTSPRSRSESIVSDVVHLNVGGEHITTLRSTLTRFPDTMLSAMFSGKYNNSTDDQGRVFIDRNPHFFKMILEWMRTDYCPNLSKEQMVPLWVELDYFGLTEEFGQSFAELFKADLNTFSLIVQPKCDECRPGNTVGDVQSESFVYGACARGSPAAVIEVWFPEAVLVSGLSVAAFFFAPWDPTQGAAASVEYHNGREWRKVSSLPDHFGKKHEVHVLKWKPKFGFRWRLHHPTALGVSRLAFH